MLIGIVGKPSSGKSSFFKACTLAEVEIANYPFTTIKPNHAVGFVRVNCVDTAFNTQCTPRFGYCIEHQRFVPVDMIDVAGLVPDAHKGAGMGSQFLNDLNQADVLIHIVDISGSVNEAGEPVPPLSYDPLNDVAFLEKELDYWYLDILKRSWDKFARRVQMEGEIVTKAIAKQMSGVGVDEKMAEAALGELGLKPEQMVSWPEEELFRLASLFRRKTKPILIAANKIDIKGSEKNLERLREAYPDRVIIPCSAEAEIALREATKHKFIRYIPGDHTFEIKGELNEKQAKALNFLKGVMEKFSGTGVQQAINTAVFDMLKYKPAYPVPGATLADDNGRILPDCYLMPPAATVLDFAYKIHADFGAKFIRAVNMKTKRSVAKDYLLQDNDVIQIIAAR